MASGRLIGGQVGALVKLMIGIIAFIGLVIVLLSILIFVLNFRLLISRSRENIQLLLQLGYQPDTLSRVLHKHLLNLFLVVLIATLAALFIWRYFHVQWLTKQGFPLPFMPHWIVFVAAFVFSIIFILVNRRNIERNVVALFR